MGNQKDGEGNSGNGLEGVQAQAAGVGEVKTKAGAFSSRPERRGDESWKRIKHNVTATRRFSGRGLSGFGCCLSWSL
jgi:hypothetical protein